MELITTPIPVIPHNLRRIVLYAAPKIGKTTFCSMLAGNCLLDLEDGSDDVAMIKYKVHSFADITEVSSLIIKANYPYKYITIDTITELENWCEQDATQMYMDSVIGKSFNRDDSGMLLPKGKQDSVLTLTQGGGYMWLRKSYNKWLARLNTLAPTLILISHLKDKVLEKKGNEVSAKDLDLTGKIKSITSAHADAIGYMYRAGDSGEQLRISFQSSDTVLCGARPAHLRGIDIEADWSKIFLNL